MTCQSPSGPTSSPISSTNPADYQVVIDHMFDVIEVGMKCGAVELRSHLNVSALSAPVYL